MDYPSDQLLDHPAWKQFKKSTLEVLKCSEEAINLSNLNSELCEIMLENTVKLIETLKTLCLIPSIADSGGEVIIKGLEVIKLNHEKVKLYEQQVKNLKLIIESNGVKN